jgi:hypothetical protein
MMKYYQKWSEFGKIWVQNLSTNSKNVKNKVKIQKLLFKIVFLDFLENNFSRKR